MIKNKMLDGKYQTTGRPVSLLAIIENRHLNDDQCKKGGNQFSLSKLKNSISCLLRRAASTSYG